MIERKNKKGNRMTQKDWKEDFYNRELSWLLFNQRVFEEAKDRTLPLLERLKFLSISASNLDEFFMIRVASLKDMVHANYKKKDISGKTAQEQLDQISQMVHHLVEEQYSLYNHSLLTALKTNQIHLIKKHEKLTKEQGKMADRYFEEIVYPVLTPMAVDSSRPFPLIRNNTINIAALIAKKENQKEVSFATVQVPAVLPRLFFIKNKTSNDLKETNREEVQILLLEELIERNLDKLFLNYNVICSAIYRIMRNADLTIDEEDAEDLLKEIQKKLKRRQWGEAIRLEVEEGADKRLLSILKKEFDIRESDLYMVNGPIDLQFLMKLYDLPNKEELRNPVFEPQPVPELADRNIFEAIREKDILLHHPYQSFEPVVEFIRVAAYDEKVLAIKQTLYRVSGNSPIVKALAAAAENGKQVTVLVELKARFDEEKNILWAKMLEKAGCHVIYGLVGLKIHGKITLVVRKEEEGIRRYVHLGTGNYNDATARLYTDMGLLTCSEAIGNDASAVFNMLSGYSEPERWNRLILAPLWMRERFIFLIEREKQAAIEGKPARIIAKMNSLCDREIMRKLYEAAASGVKIDLIVRGICCIKLGLPEIQNNITVRSIVGTFLEHSRIYYFYHDGMEDIYMGSADWMPRNLDKRVEILFPVEDEDLKQKVLHILQIQLEDNVKAHILKEDGTYERIDKRGKVLVNAQEIFMQEVQKEKE